VRAFRNTLGVGDVIQFYLTGDELVRSSPSPIAKDAASCNRASPHLEVCLLRDSGKTEVRADAPCAESRDESPSMSRQLTREAESGDSSAAECGHPREGHVDTPEARASKTPMAREARSNLLAISFGSAPSPTVLAPALEGVGGASLVSSNASPQGALGARPSRSPGAVGSWHEDEWELMEQLKLLEMSTVKKKTKRVREPGRRDGASEASGDAGAALAAEDPLIVTRIASEGHTAAPPPNPSVSHELEPLRITGISGAGAAAGEEGGGGGGGGGGVL